MEHIVPARWYFCKPNAPRLAFPTAFSSHVFWREWEENPDGPGEIGREKSADKGENTGYQGKCFLGDPAWFATGQLPESVLTDPLPDWPDCCWKPEKVIVDGRAEVGYLARGYWGLPRPYPGDAGVSYGASAALVPTFNWHSLSEYGLTPAAGFNRPPLIRGDAPFAFVTRGRLFPKPRVYGEVESVYLTAAGLVWAPAIAGSSAMALEAKSTLLRIPAIAGRAAAGYTAAAGLVGPHTYAGLAQMAYSPRAILSEVPAVRGEAGMSYTPAGAFFAVWTLSGVAQLAYAPAARGGPIYVYAGRCTVAYSGAGAFAIAVAYNGDAIMQLTPNASFTYLPNSGPGASCAAAGAMTLGTTYGPFAFPATGAIDWWKVTVVGGHTYTITFTVAGAGGMSGVIAFGSCPTPTQQNTFGAGAPSSWTPSVSGDYYLELSKVGGSGTYTIKVV